MKTKKDLIKQMIFDLENYELIYIFKRKLNLQGKDDLQMRTRAANYIERNCSDKDIDFFRQRIKKVLQMHMHSGKDYREGLINALLIKLNHLFRNESFLVQVKRHGSHDKPVFQFHGSDGTRFKQLHDFSFGQGNVYLQTLPECV